ncbi:hypothetical protein A0H81_10308 [Grifola frondosa]|uniref:Uncharacterized protein n=1 Tax=Grifola frondosa TaxID=5627 RepID=A0A1C7LY00_GRIFR|nr:hypothetical protein A0H81_10308 [Grifola frondosa]
MALQGLFQPFSPTSSTTLHGAESARSAAAEDIELALATSTSRIVSSDIPVADPVDCVNRHVYRTDHCAENQVGDNGCCTRISTSLSITCMVISKVYYHFFLLRLPATYHSRVGQLSEAVQDPFSTPELEKMWRAFSCALTKQWKLINVLCGLLLSTAVALMQISGVCGDPLMNALGIISMICALNGFLLGIIYIAHWHLSALTDVQNGDANQLASSRWRNAPALLAAPAAWLAWASLTFLTLILAYIWRAARASPPTAGAAPTALIAPMCITGVLLFALAHFVLTVHTFTGIGKSAASIVVCEEDSSRMEPSSWSRE